MSPPTHAVISSGPASTSKSQGLSWLVGPLHRPLLIQFLGHACQYRCQEAIEQDIADNYHLTSSIFVHHWVVLHQEQWDHQVQLETLAAKLHGLDQTESQSIDSDSEFWKDDSKTDHRKSDDQQEYRANKHFYTHLFRDTSLSNPGVDNQGKTRVPAGGGNHQYAAYLVVLAGKATVYDNWSDASKAMKHFKDLAMFKGFSDLTLAHQYAIILVSLKYLGCPKSSRKPSWCCTGSSQVFI